MLQTTHRSTVTEDQIDHLGHMNVRFYGINARRGTAAMTELLEVPADLELRLVDVYTRHHREQLVGTRLEVRSGVIDADDTGFGLYHELAPVDTDDLAATFVHRLEATNPHGDPITPPGAIVDRLGRDRIDVPAHGSTRSICLDTDPAARAPALDEVRTRGLAMRRIRSIEPDECDADGSVLPDAVPGLTWGGEPVGDGGHGLHEGPDGEPMGWATMETRLSTVRLPRVGDRIQSFGAAVEVRDKTSHRIQWAYDVDRGDVLTSFEIVNLAFDISRRRAMSIPDHLREMEESLLHPDLTSPVPR